MEMKLGQEFNAWYWHRRQGKMEAVKVYQTMDEIRSDTAFLMHGWNLHPIEQGDLIMCGEITRVVHPHFNTEKDACIVFELSRNADGCPIQYVYIKPLPW